MDKKFLEFWGNYFLSAAKSQEVFEELAKLSAQGLELAEKQMMIFSKIYGLEDSDKADFGRDDWWQKSFKEFRKSYVDFMELLGVVPKEDYDELAQKYEALKKILEENEEKSKGTMKGEVYGRDDMVHGVQNLIKMQAEQFQQLMGAFGDSYKDGEGKGKGKGKK